MNVASILNDAGIQLTNDIRANMGSAGINATGKTQNELRFEIKQEGTKFRLQLVGPHYFTIPTRYGRRPTPDKKPSRAMIDNITQWVEARGIDIEAVWAIATKIQQRGTRLWFEGGREDIIPPAVDEFTNTIAQNLLDAAADEFQVKIREMKW